MRRSLDVPVFDAAEIRIRAERKLGEILKLQKEHACVDQLRRIYEKGPRPKKS